ncbi:MAG TPA: T9SS type A sorting domain-containing protein [bacterium]|nr:T9SS type A sorting domain-containing protein [bacterium]
MASYCQVGGEEDDERNVIAGNGYFGITISQTEHVRVLNNFIGVRADHGDTLGNGYSGIGIRGRFNEIGPGNVISGNKRDGIEISSEAADSNRVFGNFIGTDSTGTRAWPNEMNGVLIYQGADHNRIGGPAPEERNLISGNRQHGVYFGDTGTDSNQVSGNYIGTDRTGTLALPNESGGIALFNGPRYNVIGGDEPAEGNLISGNDGRGIWFWGSGTENNRVMHNLIGTDSTGEAPLPNTTSGIHITMAAKDNLIGPGNVIAFNEDDGIYITGMDSQGNRITQNSIFQNGLQGIRLHNNAQNQMPAPEITGIGSVSGTASPESRVEIFCGPDNQGKVYQGFTTADESGVFFYPGAVSGPFITATATDAAGNTSEFSLAWHKGGLTVTTTADTGEGSLRWAIERMNQSYGADTVFFEIPDTDENFNGSVWTIRPRTALPAISKDHKVIDGFSQDVFGGNRNSLGPDVVLDGSQVEESCYYGLLLYSGHNTVRGLVIVHFNTGIVVNYNSGGYNRFYGNYIGIASDGMTPAPNGTGIYISSMNPENRFGGAAAGEGNVISGNLYIGIYCLSDSNYFDGNHIGVTADGTGRAGNGTQGLYFTGGSSHNRIGLDRGNVISGNGAAGVHIADGRDNHIAGNFIGLNAAGTDTISNQSGVFLNNACRNRIGGSTAGERNVVSGNRLDGIDFANADSNTVSGNFIGLNPAGTDTLGNGRYGLLIRVESSYNRIGGSGAGEGNRISGNRSSGIRIQSEGTGHNRVENNLIGTDAEGLARWGNRGYGVMISHSACHNRIGPGNRIAYHLNAGVRVDYTDSNRNRITRNAIHHNIGKGIELSRGSNNLMETPVITSMVPLQGTAPAGSWIEIFSDSTDQGAVFEDSVQTDGSGHFTWSGTPQGPYVTATATDADGNTSEFSGPGDTPVRLLESNLPAAFRLHQNYPNPFNPETTIRFDVMHATHVLMRVFNVLGQEVARPVDKCMEAGSHEILFRSGGLASGIYTLQVEMGEYRARRKMIILE